MMFKTSLLRKLKRFLHGNDGWGDQASESFRNSARLEEK